MNRKEMLKNLHLSIDSESVNIYVEMGEDNNPIHVVYWHIDEVKEDADISISMATAIDLFYRNPDQLLDIVGL